MLRKLVWLVVAGFSFAFIITAVAGPAVAVAACAGVLLYVLARSRRAATQRAEAAEVEAASEAVIAEAEAVIAAARVRLLGGAGS